MATSVITKELTPMGATANEVTLPYTCTTDVYCHAVLVPSSSTSVYWYLNITLPGGTTVLSAYLFSTAGSNVAQFFFAPKGSVISEYGSSASGISSKRLRVGRLN